MRFALADDPVYVSEQLGHTEATFSMQVYAKAARRRDRLSGAYLAEYDRALQWAERSIGQGMGSEPGSALRSTGRRPLAGCRKRLCRAEICKLAPIAQPDRATPS
jgi:hypothetical protein